MKKEIPIIKVTLAATPTRKQPWKGPTNCYRDAFHLDVDYHLQDGRIISGDVCSQRKKDLAGRLESAQRSAAGNATYALFNDDGEYYGTKSVWMVDGRGMNPSPGPLIPEPAAGPALLAA
jgi:hypothetical protein